MQLLNTNNPLTGHISVPGDKSISHRSIMFGAIANGKTTIHNFLRADDCLSTLNIFKKLGVDIHDDGDVIEVTGVGMRGLNPVTEALDVGNSGTTIRLIMGILVSQGHQYTLTGDASIRKRPMGRVIAPLQQMGANLSGINGSELAPITIEAISNIHAIDYKMPIASAQVKSAIIFASLYAKETTTIAEKELTRNHTEVMLTQFGGKISVLGKEISIPGNQVLSGTTVFVPGDFSSAAFFIVAALLVPGSDITIKQVGLTPTRTGLIEVIKKMGGYIEIMDFNEADESGDIRVRYSQLEATEIAGDIIPSLIDELPLVALLGCAASGVTVIKDAQELKVKETDRIECVATELNKLGACIKTTKDGMIIEGERVLHGGVVDSHHDHRIGMMLQITALTMPISEVVILNNSGAVSVSYPDFYSDIKKLAEA